MCIIAMIRQMKRIQYLPGIALMVPKNKNFNRRFQVSPIYIDKIHTKNAIFYVLIIIKYIVIIISHLLTDDR